MKSCGIRRGLAGLGTVILLASLAVGCTAGQTTSPPDLDSAQTTWEPGPPTYGQLQPENVRVEMSDGVLLDATVSYPANLDTGERASGEFPVILNITPYAAEVEPAALEHGTLFTQHGYIFASVSIRGTQKSGGSFGLFSQRDSADGVDIVNWAANKLDGSDGAVGGYGCSYPGMAMIATAGTVGKGSPLKAIVPSCTGWDNIREMSLVGGIPTGDSVLFDLMPGYVGDQQSAQDVFGAVANDVRTGGPAAYSDFWADRQPMNFAKSIVDNDIPTLLWTGWGDVNRRGALEMYAEMQSEANDTGSTNGSFFLDSGSSKYQIIVGPWPHTVGLDPDVMLKWYDTWVKGESTGLDRTTQPMHLYEQGSDRWINSTSYPLVNNYETFYVGSNGALGGSAQTEPGFDSIAWTSPDQPGGSLDYTTAPFADGATFAGPSSVEVSASTNTTNLALTATLLDVAPDGSEQKITFGTILGSQSSLDPDLTWRDINGALIRPFTTQTRDTYLTPERPQTFSIALHPDLWSVEPGHSLRLRFTTQPSAQECSVDGGVGVLLPCLPNEPQRASLSGGLFNIGWTADAPSAVHLPLMPYRCFEASEAKEAPNTMNVGIPSEWSSSANQC